MSEHISVNFQFGTVSESQNRKTETFDKESSPSSNTRLEEIKDKANAPKVSLPEVSQPNPNVEQLNELCGSNAWGNVAMPGPFNQSPNQFHNVNILPTQQIMCYPHPNSQFFNIVTIPQPVQYVFTSVPLNQPQFWFTPVPSQPIKEQSLLEQQNEFRKRMNQKIESTKRDQDQNQNQDQDQDDIFDSLLMHLPEDYNLSSPTKQQQHSVIDVKVEQVHKVEKNDDIKERLSVDDSDDSHDSPDDYSDNVGKQYQYTVNELLDFQEQFIELDNVQDCHSLNPIRSNFACVQKSINIQSTNNKEKRIKQDHTSCQETIPKPQQISKLKSNPSNQLKKKVRGILNKITPTNFGKLSSQLIEVINKMVDDEDKLKTVLRSILDKASFEPSFADRYADLCQCIAKAKKLQDVLKFACGVNLQTRDRFCEILRQLCKECYELYDKSLRIVPHHLDTNERMEYQSKKKRQLLGIMTMIGELFNKSFDVRKLILEIIKSHVGCHPIDEFDIEVSCTIFCVVGKKLDTRNGKHYIDQYFEDMRTYSQHMERRLHFMILNLEEIRNNKWNKDSHANGATHYGHSKSRQNNRPKTLLQWKQKKHQNHSGRSRCQKLSPQWKQRKYLSHGLNNRPQYRPHSSYSPSKTRPRPRPRPQICTRYRAKIEIEVEKSSSIISVTSHENWNKSHQNHD